MVEKSEGYVFKPTIVDQEVKKTHPAGLENTAIPQFKIKIIEIPHEKYRKPQCPPPEVNSESCAHTTKMALGLPMVADFMTYFPVYLYRDTFTNCTDFILTRFNTRNFEEAFKKFYRGTDFLSPVVIIISYAWFFERNRYDWNLKICTNLASYNKRFPIDHKIAPQHTKSILSQPQTAYHVPYFKGTLFPNILLSYCLSHEAAGNHQAICSNCSVSVTDNLVLFNHDLHSVTLAQTPCTGSRKNDCLKVLERHFNQVALDIKSRRNIEWRDFQTVEKLANEDDIICTSEVTKATD